MGELADEFGGLSYRGLSRRPSCDKCGKGGLLWQLVKHRWRLQEEDGKLHFCAVKATDFPIIKE